jgi:hypothetical protein
MRSSDFGCGSEEGSCENVTERSDGTEPSDS